MADMPIVDLSSDPPDRQHAEALRVIGADIEASIDQVGTEISDLTAAVRELTELVKEMAVFPHQSTTRRVFRWCFNR